MFWFISNPSNVTSLFLSAYALVQSTSSKTLREPCSSIASSTQHWTSILSPSFTKKCVFRFRISNDSLFYSLSYVISMIREWSGKTRSGPEASANVTVSLWLLGDWCMDWCVLSVYLRCSARVRAGQLCSPQGHDHRTANGLSSLCVYVCLCMFPSFLSFSPSV